MTVSTTGEWPIKRLLTEVVGSGPKTADDMTREQAAEAFERILAGDPAPTTLGAFLLANRWKGNTPVELAAFLDVMREQSVTIAEPACDPVDCGANYDGKEETAILGVAAGLVAASAGVPIVVHSGDRIPTKRADAYQHVLEELDVRTDLEPKESAQMVDETGFGYYSMAAFNPGVDALLDDRELMGVRTFINTIETLANPANASVHLGSFFHLNFARRMLETIRASETLSVSRIMLIQGLEGYDDIRPRTSRIAEFDGEITDYEVEPGAYGLTVDRSDLTVAAVASDSASLTTAVLSGDREEARSNGAVARINDGAVGRITDAVALNAAIRIYAGGAVDSIREGLEVARVELASDGPAKRLEAIRDF